MFAKTLADMYRRAMFNMFRSDMFHSEMSLRDEIFKLNCHMLFSMFVIFIMYYNL